MGIHVLSNDGQDYDRSTDHAVMYCSTTDWAFGPVFSDDDEHGARERLDSFLRFMGGTDPRRLSDAELEGKYGDWRRQEAEQWAREAAAERDGDDPDGEPIYPPFPPARPGRCEAPCGKGGRYPCDRLPGHTGGHAYSEDDYPQRTCPHCDGKPLANPGDYLGTETCPVCAGTGHVSR